MKSIIIKYKDLGFDKTIDYDKFNSISIVHHSTAIEGSTLTEVETSVLINEGLTPKGKPLEHSLMVTDHYNALNFVLERSKKKFPVSLELIKKINSLILKNTGVIRNTVFGTIDETKGELRRGNVHAGDTYFPDFEKVPKLLNELILGINNKMKENLSIEEQVNLSFDTHFDLVSLHPFYDGNGRTSRLLMNYIQQYYNLPLAIVRSESKVDYIQALIDTREKEDLNVFRSFMGQEYSKQLQKEIEKYEDLIKPNRGKGRGFSFIF